jgi:hypothetical protein
MAKTAAELQAEIDARKAELDALQEAQREEARKIQAALEQQKWEAKRLETYKKYEVFAAEIVKELKAVGFKKAAIVETEENWPNISVPDSYARVSFDTVYSGDIWHSRGHMAVRVESYTYSTDVHPRTFNPLKAGGFNYAGIAKAAKEISGIVDGVEHKRDLEENNRRASGTIVKRLEAKYGEKSSYSHGDNVYYYVSDVKYTSSQWYSDKVKVTVDSLSLTEEQAGTLTELVKNFLAGVKLQEAAKKQEAE